MSDIDYRARAHGVRLRPFAEDDIAALVKAFSDPLTRRFLRFLPDPYGPDEAGDWVRTGSLASRPTGGAALAVADPDTDQLLGSVSLFGSPSVGPRRGGELAYWVGPWARGRGVATAAVRAVAGWAAGRGVERLEILTDVANPRSQRVALASGFRREGIRRGAARLPDGGRRDLIAYAWLAGDPVQPRPRLLPDLPGGYLSDGVVTLTPSGPDDADDRYRLAQLPEVVMSSVPPVAPTLEAVQERCAGVEAAWLAGERAELMIRDAATHAVTGQIALFYWEPTTGQAMIGYDLLPEWRGRGYTTLAARLVGQWAFQHTGIKRLIAGTAPENRASQRTLENAGFRREGYQRSRLPGPDGTRIDDVLYALLPEDL